MLDGLLLCGFVCVLLLMNVCDLFVSVLSGVVWLVCLYNCVCGCRLMRVCFVCGLLCDVVSVCCYDLVVCLLVLFLRVRVCVGLKCVCMVCV